MGGFHGLPFFLTTESIPQYRHSNLPASKLQKRCHMRRSILLLFLIAFYCSSAYAQGTAADYERANGLKAKYEAAAIDIAGQATWIGNTHRFWYRKLSTGAYEYLVFDADTMQKRVAFDHAKIAAALSKLPGSATLKANDLQLAALRFDNTAATFFATVDGTAVR